MPWIAVFILRLALPLTILRWPLAGNFLAFFADLFDVVIFDFLGGEDYARYDFYDKWLDLYWYVIAVFTAFSWKDKFGRNILSLLLSVRAIGTILFTTTSNKVFLVVFPDLFVWFLLFYLVYERFFKKRLTPALIVLVLLLMLPLKLYQEYLLHFDVIDFYNWVWTNIYTPLGLDKIM